ncbi:hypothetical protein JV59_25935 (plasmid) [Vibrio coralliilyticus]|nr:hypothetical protein JV59_25935 [Vibrio coralliilyticus]
MTTRMMPLKSLSLQDYLNTHFLRRSELAKRLSVRSDTLSQLIASGMIPSWSYKVNQGAVYTQVFGQHEARDCHNDEYFSPSVLDWYRHHRAQFPDHKTVPPLTDQLCGQFVATFVKTAQASETFRWAFAEAMSEPGALQAMATTTWHHHRQGTYGVCVRQPSSVAAIIEKQVAVEALTRITNHGQKSRYTEQECGEWRQWAEVYDRVAMPFSPVDYAQSSRKRLIDDVLDSLPPD